MKDIYFSSIVW